MFITYVYQEIEVNAMVLSAQFWPAFREEKIKLPDVMQKLLEEYTKKFETLKGNRTLNWKPHLGKVKKKNLTEVQFCSTFLIFFFCPHKTSELVLLIILQNVSHSLVIRTHIGLLYISNFVIGSSIS